MARFILSVHKTYAYLSVIRSNGKREKIIETYRKDLINLLGFPLGERELDKETALTVIGRFALAHRAKAGSPIAVLLPLPVLKSIGATYLSIYTILRSRGVSPEEAIKRAKGSLGKVVAERILNALEGDSKSKKSKKKKSKKSKK